jgi:hypothetical protein
MNSDKHNLDKLFKLIHDILLEDWDPIGINIIPEAWNEYEQYIPEIAKLLSIHSEKSQLISYLGNVRTQYMSLPKNIEKDSIVAEKLITAFLLMSDTNANTSL